MSERSTLGGVIAMSCATASFVFGDTFMKLTAEDLPPFEVLFLRGVAASLACAVLLALRGEAHSLPSLKNPLVLLRAASETLSVLCYILALARLPIADTIAISQTAPLILILGAAFLLKERVGPIRVALVLAGFAGAVMVAQPNAAGVTPAALFALGSALLIAVRDLFGRSVPPRIPVTIVALATLMLTMVVAGLLSLVVETWTPPTPRHLGFLTIAGLAVTLGHALLLLAYRLGKTSVIAPFFYSFALWAVISGAIVWRALPNPMALAGIVLICASGVAIVLVDRVRAEAFSRAKEDFVI